jgi:nitrate reductase cytochrome c-type subunit
MFDKIAGRALVPVGVVVTGFLTVCFVLLYAAIKDIVVRDAVGHAQNLAGMVLKSTRYAMLNTNRELSNTIIQNLGEQKGVEHVRIFNKEGVVAFSSNSGELNHQVDRKSQGCMTCHDKPMPASAAATMQKARTFKNYQGKDVMAITAPIYNEPECANAACHVHPVSQKVLGTVDIGLSHQPTLDSLASIRLQMLFFSLLTLVLTVAGVITLLKIIVLAPLKELQNYTDSTDTNAILTEPRNLPYELDKIAKSYYFIRTKLKEIDKSL